MTSLPAATKGWRANPACIDAAHRVHARVEDGVRTGKDCDIGRFPSRAFQLNAAWFAAALIAATLLARLRLLALDGALTRAEPKTLRSKILHAAARITRGARRRQLRVQASWPWAAGLEKSMEGLTVSEDAHRSSGRVGCPQPGAPGRTTEGSQQASPGFGTHGTSLPSGSRAQAA